MKLFDLRLRGSGFTLGTLVSEEDHMNFRELIGFLQCNANKEDELQQSFKFEEKVTDNPCARILNEAEFQRLTTWAVDNGYCTQKDDILTFTEKAISVFEKTIEKDNELAKSGFSCCPCHR